MKKKRINKKNNIKKRKLIYYLNLKQVLSFLE